MPARSKCIPLLLCSALFACEGAVNIDLSATPPEDVDSAILQIKTVRLLGENANTQSFDLADNFEINLLTIDRGSARRLLSDKKIPAGNYSGIELVLEAESDTLDSYLSKDGENTSLIVRAGRDTQADNSFRIKDEENSTITLHFDLRSSLLRDASADGDRELIPQLRLVDNEDSGTLSGDVATALLEQQGCDDDNDPSLGEVVYVFSGNSITIDELDGQNAEPISTALISRDAANADYIAAFLPAGNYTVAVSCNADLDDPLQDDGISFIASDTATITAGSSTTLNFSLSE
ncbi:MAG: DUF4382 domain-containing protein [Oceanococcus sp.]